MSWNYGALKLQKRSLIFSESQYSHAYNVPLLPQDRLRGERSSLGLTDSALAQAKDRMLLAPSL